MADQNETSHPQAQARFQLLRQLILDAAAGRDTRKYLAEAVERSLSVTGVDAGAVTLFDEKGKVSWSVVKGEDIAAARLEELEESLLKNLRTTHRVRSLYMTIELEQVAGVFSYPLRAADKVYGAISGIARGERNLAVEEEFISAASAAMALALALPGGPMATDDIVRAARLAVIAETAVAVNHEVNNYLMAISGNVDLLLKRLTDLPPETIRLLKNMEEGARHISEVTEKLRNLKVYRTKPYIDGTRMLDLDADSSDSEDSDKE